MKRLFGIQVIFTSNESFLFLVICLHLEYTDSAYLIGKIILKLFQIHIQALIINNVMFLPFVFLPCFNDMCSHHT